jgi:hypothetical protein
MYDCDAARRSARNLASIHIADDDAANPLTPDPDQPPDLAAGASTALAERAS